MELILMASGLSKRFGKNKLFVDFKDKPLFEHALQIYSDIDEITSKVVVSQYEKVLCEGEKLNFIPVFNSESKLGISKSITHGLESLGYKKDIDYTDDRNSGIIFAVCDQPLLQKETIKRLISAYKNSKKGIISLRYGTRNGNPKIFSKKYISELFKLTGDMGGKQIINKHSKDILFVNASKESELFDIDTVEDLNELYLNEIGGRKWKM